MSLRRILGKLRRRLRPRRPRPSILMYHRVISVKHDPWGLAVDPEIFDEQMRFLRQHRTPMPVDEMVEQLQRGTLPNNAIGVTFDDAYLDNLIHAKPSLVRYQIPATVFVPTALIGRTVPFWWDELSAMILDSETPCDSQERCGSENIKLRWGARERNDAAPAWRGWETPTTMRQATYVALWSRMQRLTEEQRAPVLERLRCQFSTEWDPASLPMTREQIEEMIEGDLVRIGAHTVHHTSLSDESLERGRLEIQQSKKDCTDLARRSVGGFAYPYGNMTADICREVERAGYVYGCAAEAGFLDQKSQDRYTLPRIPAPNAAGREFASLLKG